VDLIGGKNDDDFLRGGRSGEWFEDWVKDYDRVVNEIQCRGGFGWEGKGNVMIIV
jgi:hypothetical protein